MDWSGVDYLWIIVMFLSAVWTHSDGTHSLQRINWCNAKFLQICSDEQKLIYILDALKVSTFSANCSFWVNFSIKIDILCSITHHYFFLFKCVVKKM